MLMAYVGCNWLMDLMSGDDIEEVEEVVVIWAN